jgi:hypothetical protein
VKGGEMRSPKRITVARKNKRRRTTARVYKKVGYCAVDSGQLIITDPGYLNHFKFDADEEHIELSKQGKDFEYSYSGCMAATMSQKGAGQLLGRTLSKETQKLVREGKLPASRAFYHAGVAVSTGVGDGRYPVYVEYEDGMIKSVKVQFFE